MEEIQNIFDIGNIHSQSPEVFEGILEKGNIKVERIITLKPYDKPGQWYDQELDEWVILLKGNAVIEIKNEGKVTLTEGDYIFLQAHKIHRIRQTSKAPSCVWLAIHGKLK